LEAFVIIYERGQSSLALLRSGNSRSKRRRGTHLHNFTAGVRRHFARAKQDSRGVLQTGHTSWRGDYLGSEESCPQADVMH
jgi:hypothetical protein